MFEEILDSVDVSFKWILLAFNFITIIMVYLHKRKNKPIKQHSILFVTAHPDDQCMFFRPTIVNLRQTYIIHLLCLSGKQTSRQHQLYQACKQLKVDHATCVKDQKLIDGMKEKWCEQTIRKYVCNYIRENKIKAVFTFDKDGVSDHSNHQSIYNSIQDLQTKQVQQNKQQKQRKQHKQNKENKQSKQIKENTKVKQQKQQLKEITQTQQKRDSTIKVYYLESVSLIRKYLGILQLPLSILKTYSWIQFSPFSAYSAMSKHKSQFVWYRRLWIVLSRYEYINTYRRALIRTNEQI